MSSLFSVSKLLGKSRAKRALPTRSSSSMSVSTVEKEKGGTPKSSTIALHNQPPIVSTNTATITTITVSDAPKAGPYMELESTSVKGRSSPPMSEVTSVIAETGSQSMGKPLEEPGYAVVPIPQDTVEISEKQKSGKEPVVSVEEPGYDVVSQPEATKSEVEWTELEPATNMEEKKANDSEVVPIVVTDGVDVSVASMSQQDGAQHVTTDDSEGDVTSANIPLSTERTQDGENALNTTHAEIQTKSRIIEDLLCKIERMEINIATLERSIEETLERNGQEKSELVEETHRLKGIIEVGRLDNRQKIEGLEKEREALKENLDTQQERISQLEERLAEGREASERVDTRNRKLENQLRRYEEDLVQVETDRVAEKNSHIRMLEKNNENLASQLVQLQSSLNDSERQNRMFLDQLRRQSNELQLQASKGDIARLGSTLWGKGSMIGATRVESAISTVRLLNEEIFQTAAALTDQLEDIPKRFVVEDDGASAKAEILKSILGLELVKNLQEEAQLPSEECNPLFVQIALQGCLTASCTRIITSWYPAEWEYGNFLVALYERIRGTGGPEIALNWKKATQQSCTPPTDRNAKLVAHLTEQIEAVLSVCGWSKQSAVDDVLSIKYSQNLAGIVSHAIRLNSLTIAGEGRDVETVLVEAEKMFNPSEMTNDSPFDNFARMSKIDAPSDEEVVCTTALGLKSADNDSSKPDQLLLKPKVFLNGGLL